jgi:hypothetical protein
MYSTGYLEENVPIFGFTGDIRDLPPQLNVIKTWQHPYPVAKTGNFSLLIKITTFHYDVDLVMKRQIHLFSRTKCPQMTEITFLTFPAPPPKKKFGLQSVKDSTTFKIEK